MLTYFKSHTDNILFVALVFFFACMLTYSANLSAAEQEEKKTTPAETSEKDKDKAETTDSSEESKDASTTATFNRADIEINNPVNAFEQQKQDIEHYLNADNITPILVGPNDYITLTEPHTTAINKGVMIILPDWHQGAVSVNALNQLRKSMPHQGWTTITVHPPLKPENYPSQALKKEERLTENNETLSSYKENLVTIMNTISDKAKNYPGVILTIAEGSHAALMVDIYQEGLIPAPTALIMLSAYMDTPSENSTFAQQVAYSSYPILDLYLKRDHRLAKANATSRQSAVKNELKAYYRQKQLTNHITANYPQKTLAKEIIGWLKSIGW